MSSSLPHISREARWRLHHQEKAWTPGQQIVLQASPGLLVEPFWSDIWKVLMVASRLREQDFDHLAVSATGAAGGMLAEHTTRASCVLDAGYSTEPALLPKSTFCEDQPSVTLELVCAPLQKTHLMFNSALPPFSADGSEHIHKRFQRKRMSASDPVLSILRTKKH